jgi:hypothetical protein
MLNLEMFSEFGHPLTYRRAIEIDPGNDARILRNGRSDILARAQQKYSAKQARGDEHERGKPTSSYQWINLLGLAA